MYFRPSNRRIQRLFSTTVFTIFTILLSVSSGCATSNHTDFSFVVLGDTRGELFVPGGVKQEAEIKTLIKGRYKKEPYLKFDPDSGQLASINVEKHGKKKSYRAIYKDGWPQIILRGDGDQARVVMRDSGRKWVFKRIAAAFNPNLATAGKSPLFCVHTGDLIIWGAQGQDLNQSPYWQRFQEGLLAKLPPPDPSLGIPGSIFPALGNHETWFDNNLKGLLTTLPYLSKTGFTPENRIYSFTHAGCRFIFLDSGGYKDGIEGWWAYKPGFKKQMAALTGWLQKAKEEKARQVFIVYHKPSYCITGHGPLLDKWNPKRIIEPFAKELSITVFNGHVHTTEIYRVNGVRYLVLGGGGAPQRYEPDPPADYPAELYWGNKPRVEEYNFLMATVKGNKLKLAIHRFRPSQVQAPMEEVEVLAD
jgi:hypothetical protein